MSSRGVFQKLASARSWLEGFNRVFSHANLRLDTLTAARLESRRLENARARGVFQRPVFPVPPCFASVAHKSILDALPRFTGRFDTLTDPSANDVGYQYRNPYYRSPDAEVLYAIMRLHQPKRILETGCGHSTRITRQAIIDGKFSCRLTCIDPNPRREIEGFADEFIRAPIESLDPAALAGGLEAGDVLFIDTSHEIRVANDCAFIYGALLPLLKPGVIVHIHDIFLPWEYPDDWIFEWHLGSWGEQYLVQALLGGNQWDVLWPGYHLQKTLPDFAQHFPHIGSQLAQSLWLKRK